MKKILKVIVYIVLLFILFLLIGGLFAPKEYTLEKSIAINAPVDEVWKHTNTLEALDTWSPFDDEEVGEHKQNFTGVPGNVGSKQCWDGKKTGKGCQEITAIQPMKRMDTKLSFDMPWGKSYADAWVQLDKAESGTIAYWGFHSTSPYPLNALGLLFNFESTMEKMYSKGLQSLKTIAEQ